jgi:glycosyltransferase involved in cell wall biosynthesis
MRPTISIIVPVYNVEKYLPNCINSVLNQISGNEELILIDDGSTDNSGLICDEFAHLNSRIKIKHTRNQGVSEARNTGIRAAKGDWLLFLDGDDILELNTIEIINQHIKSYEELDMVIGSFKSISEHHTNHYVNSSRLEKGIKIVFEYGIWQIKTRIGAFVIKKEIVDKHHILFNKLSKYGEDVEFINYCLINSARVKVTSEYFMKYIIHNQSAIAKVSFDRYDVFESRLRTLSYIQKRFPECENIESLYQDYLLPEAIIDTTYLLCRQGVNPFKIIRFLEEKKYDRIIISAKENVYTPVNIKVRINKFIQNPLLTWGECFLSTKLYIVRKGIGIIKRRVLN